MYPPTVCLVLGNQLFDPALFAAHRDAVFVLCEDRALCTYQRFHQQKLVLLLTAMRHHAEALRAAGYAVRYQRLDVPGALPLFDFLAAELTASGARRLLHVEIEGRHMAKRLDNFAAHRGLTVVVLPNPMFCVSINEFDRHAARRRKPQMAAYYRAVREREGLLMTSDKQPQGGRWSFDEDNRQRLPPTVTPPPLLALSPDVIQAECVALVAREFPSHPGHAGQTWLPATRAEARLWLEDFLTRRFADFGAYEDAMSQRSATIYHSILSPFLNLGLLTPREVIEAALAHARIRAIPLNSVEGFVRQVIGWREFVRGIYRRHGAAQARSNFWGHTRKLGSAWYRGTTGIPPLDTAIEGALTRGWNHHIERLMVIGNLMLLAEIAPPAAYRWFMEMYVDAYGWVMEPNVYGMALYSDGGVFATKPYLCGSNYLLKMSDYRRGTWCDTVDGLYWRFVALHRGFFESNPRLSVITRNLDCLDPVRRARISAAAEMFLAEHTLTADSASAS